MNIDQEKKIAAQCYRQGRYDDALEAAQKLVKHNERLGFFICALLYELGVTKKGKNLERAYGHYDTLRKAFDDLDGYMGCARIILQNNDLTSAAKAEKFCIHVIDKTKDPIAYLLLGRLYEELFGQSHYELAKKNYLKAGLRGSAWAWRKYAQLNMRMGHALIGITMHVFATLISPILVLIGGMRSSRRG